MGIAFGGLFDPIPREAEKMPYHRETDSVSPGYFHAFGSGDPGKGGE